jgi:hypothetical protein
MKPRRARRKINMARHDHPDYVLAKVSDEQVEKKVERISE